ncbi:glycosyltransferase family 4 protein [Natronospora cellulosivora (SeqCode)]
MKIMMLKAYFEPEKAASLYLTNNLIEDLALAKYKIDVYTPIPTRGISDEVRKEYKSKNYEEKYDGRVKIYRFPMFSEGRNPLIRAIRYICCSFIYLAKGLFAKDMDLIFVGSTPPIMGLVGAIIKKFKKVPMIYNLQDIFPDSLVSTGLTSKKSLLWKIGRIIENITYKSADKIIVISEDFSNNIMLKGVPKEKIEVVYNWVDEKAVIPIKRKNNILFDKYDLDRNHFYVVYAGNLGHAQNIEVILEAAKEVSIQQKDIKFLIFGNGKQEDYYKGMLKSMGLKNTYIYPLQAYSLVSNVYSMGDVSIVSCKEGLGKSAMPSKSWSIMSAGTALIANFDEGTELQNIIEDNNIGIFTKAGDVDGLVSAILKLYKNENLRFQMGKNGRRFIVEHLSRKNSTKKIRDIIKSTGG